MDYGRPSLELDLMEEWRPIIVDTLVLSVFNLKTISLSDFEVRDEIIQKEDEEIGLNEDIQPHSSQDKVKSVILTEAGFRKFITQFERKMNQKVQYHLTGEQLTYRDCIREQVRHFARYLKGEEPQYQPISLK
jgi:CRISPR-associated protein Cas1